MVTNRDVWNPGAPAKETAVATDRGVWNPVALPQELQWLHIVAPGILGALRRLTWGGWAVGRVSVFPSYSLRPPPRPAGRAQPRRPLSPHISRPPQSALSMEPTRSTRSRFRHIQYRVAREGSALLLSQLPNNLWVPLQRTRKSIRWLRLAVRGPHQSRLPRPLLSNERSNIPWAGFTCARPHLDCMVAH